MLIYNIDYDVVGRWNNCIIMISSFVPIPKVYSLNCKTTLSS